VLKKRLLRVPVCQLMHFNKHSDRHTKMDKMTLFHPLLVPPALSVMQAAFFKTVVKASLSRYSCWGGCKR
jgi:hypothetical protein